MTLTVVLTLLALIAVNMLRHKPQAAYRNHKNKDVIILADEWIKAKDKFTVVTDNTNFYVDALVSRIHKFHAVYDTSFRQDFDAFHTLVRHTLKISKHAAEIKFRLPSDCKVVEMHALLTRRTLRMCIAYMNDVISRHRTSKWRVPLMLYRSAETA